MLNTRQNEGVIVQLLRIIYALLVKWYNEAMVRLNCKSDSYLGHHLLITSFLRGFTI